MGKKGRAGQPPGRGRAVHARSRPAVAAGARTGSPYASSPAALLHPRAADQLHVLTEQHLTLFATAARARPDLAPLLDLRRFEAGCESIEELSRRLHGALVAHGLDPHLFSIFCELNAGRLLATIARHLDDEGLPLDDESILGELYSRLHRWYFERGADSPCRPMAPERSRFQAMGRETTVIHGLSAVAAQIVAERVSMLRAAAIPTNSTPAPIFAVAETLIVDAARHLTERRLRLRTADLRRWITCALLGMPGAERRLIHLRCRRDLPLREIAARLELAPFEAGVRLRNAVAAMHDEIERLLRLHEGFPPAGEFLPALARPPGRLLELRPRTRETAATNDATEPATDTASSDDEGADDE